MKFYLYQFEVKFGLAWRHASMSRRILFSLLSSWINQSFSMVESLTLKEVISWLVVIWFKRLRTARMHPSFELSLLVLVAQAISEHSFLQYTQLVDQYARQRNTVPVFEAKHFFGQLKCILILELPSAPRLNLATPTTIILAVIQNAKAKLTNEHYYYKELGIRECHGFCHGFTWGTGQGTDFCTAKKPVPVARVGGFDPISNSARKCRRLPAQHSKLCISAHHNHQPPQ